MHRCALLQVCCDPVVSGSSITACFKSCGLFWGLPFFDSLHLALIHPTRSILDPVPKEGHLLSGEGALLSLYFT